MAKLSEPKRNALDEVFAADGYRVISAGTIGALEKQGLIERLGDHRYYLTDAGVLARATGETPKSK